MSDKRDSTQDSTASTPRIAILGASRGLGACFVRLLRQEEVPPEVLLVARKESLLADEQKLWPAEQAQLRLSDFSRESEWAALCSSLEAFRPHKIFYFAGGGPYGDYSTKEWKDHLWAWQVSFLTPARLLYWALRNGSESLQQVVFAGSAVAESQPDPRAASYASAKHGLKGLVRSVQGEQPSLDIRLYSPSYMDTQLLPPQARPRREGAEILSPEDVARDLWAWSQAEDESGHRIFQ